MSRYDYSWLDPRDWEDAHQAWVERQYTISEEPIEEGDECICLFNDSGHKFWFKRDQILKVQLVQQMTRTPNRLYFEDLEKIIGKELPDPNGKYFYANDFRKIIRK